MSETISIMFDENGIAKEYDDTFDITIHCESEEEQNKVLEILNRRWIPVSEKLPEECSGVLVYCPANYNVFLAYLEQGKWYIFSPDGNEPLNEPIVAWMPLPEPYKEVSE